MPGVCGGLRWLGGWSLSDHPHTRSFDPGQLQGLRIVAYSFFLCPVHEIVKLHVYRAAVGNIPNRPHPPHDRFPSIPIGPPARRRRPPTVRAAATRVRTSASAHLASACSVPSARRRQSLGKEDRYVEAPWLGVDRRGDPGGSGCVRCLADGRRLGDAAVVIAGARGAPVSVLAGGARHRRRVPRGEKKPGRLYNGWATPSKPPGHGSGARPSVALRLAPFEAARLGRDRGEVPRAVCADSQSVALSMPQGQLISSVADASARCKPLTPSQGGDRVALAAGGAGAHVRAAWGQPGGNAGQHGDRPGQRQRRWLGCAE